MNTSPQFGLSYPGDHDLNKIVSTLPKVASTQDSAFQFKWVLRRVYMGKCQQSCNYSKLFPF